MAERRRNGRSRSRDLAFGGIVAAALAIPLALVVAVAASWQDEIRGLRAAADGATWTLRITVTLGD